MLLLVSRVGRSTESGKARHTSRWKGSTVTALPSVLSVEVMWRPEAHHRRLGGLDNKDSDSGHFDMTLPMEEPMEKPRRYGGRDCHVVPITSSWT